jgi:hypothetical protein
MICSHMADAECWKAEARRHARASWWWRVVAAGLALLAAVGWAIAIGRF